MHTSGSWVTRYSWPNRMAYQVWERSVPRIADSYNDCAVYIYQSMLDARIGEHFGGSGFLCHVPFQTNTNWSELYVVTNWHVVKKAKTPVIRLNRKDGFTECIEAAMDNWFQHPDGDDIAVFPLRTEYETLNIYSFSVADFVSPEKIADEDIGIGDDTVMIGRFVNHEGTQRNSPAVRFGNIAMMNHEKIVNEETGVEQEAFLVEVRSLPGYSGSAVLIYSPCAMNDMSTRRRGLKREGLPPQGEMPSEGFFAQLSPKGPFLLGIDFCHINRRGIVRDRFGKAVTEGWYVDENTGMAGVIPAWKIKEVLGLKELKEMRDKEDSDITGKKDKSAASLDTAERDDSVFTKEDFEATLTKASRKISSKKK
jgi:hypothetical protein